MAKLYIAGTSYLHGGFVYDRATALSNNKVWTYAGQSQRDVKIGNSLKIYIFDLHGSPVSR